VWALVRVNDELLSEEIAIPAPIDSRAFEARIQDAPFISTNTAQGVAAGRAGRVPGTLEMDDLVVVFKERLQSTGLVDLGADLPVRRREKSGDGNGA
jgi:hypothetical protein